MPRTFAYVRVSTTGQTTDNQLREIAAAGFKIEPHRVVTETISGSVATAQRRGFTRLLDRLEPGDVLVVSKLDRLGRNAMDVGSTVAKLAEIGVRVHCLALGGVDLDQLDRQADHERHQRRRGVRARPPDRAHPGWVEPGQGGGQDAWAGRRA